MLLLALCYKIERLDEKIVYIFRLLFITGSYSEVVIANLIELSVQLGFYIRQKLAMLLQPVLN